MINQYNRFLEIEMKNFLYTVQDSVSKAAIHDAKFYLENPDGSRNPIDAKKVKTKTLDVPDDCKITASAFGLWDSLEVVNGRPTKRDSNKLEFLIGIDFRVDTYTLQMQNVDPWADNAIAHCTWAEQGAFLVIKAFPGNFGEEECPSKWKWDIKIKTSTKGGARRTSTPCTPIVNPQNNTECYFILDTSSYSTDISYEVTLTGPNTQITGVGSVKIVPSRGQGQTQIFTPQVPGARTVVSTSSRSFAGPPQSDLALWVVIRNATEGMSFANFETFMDFVMYGKSIPGTASNSRSIRQNQVYASQKFLPFMDSEAYRSLKVASEAFLKVHCAVVQKTLPPLPKSTTDLVNRRVNAPVDQQSLAGFWKDYLQQINGTNDPVLPYLQLIHEKLPDLQLTGGANPQAPLGSSRLKEKLISPCLLELIWSYWQEEGMLVQTMNAISRRFQNIPSGGGRDPLANLETDPLRPLNNLLWGYIQDEQHRLTVARRCYEYDHHYGLTLYGKAAPKRRGADTRSRFLEAYHNLLFLCTQFFQQDDDTNIISDGFPVLNALKEVHLILTQGAHNQFGDLPTTARGEMLMQQWLLARPEFREFLPTRIMVALPEPWMDRVDAMKALQGWSDVSVLHFRNLAEFGEQILLSIRYGAWSTINDADDGKYWARYWRSEIQGYIHAYRAVTGVDLTREPVDCTLPSELLRKRIAAMPFSA